MQFQFLLLQCFLYRFLDPPIHVGSFTLYIPFWLILTLHLLIMQATTRVLVPSDALPNLLWVTATKTVLFRSFFSHKYDQRVWWDAINVVAATIPPTTSGLTPSLKLFLHSVAPFLFYRPSVRTPQHSNGLIGFGYDTWYYYLIKFLYPTIIIIIIIIIIIKPTSNTKTTHSYNNN